MRSGVLMKLRTQFFFFFVDPGPESIADIGLAPCHGNGRGELDPNLGRNAIVTDLALVVEAEAAATREVGTVLETGAESDPGGGTEVSVRGYGTTFMVQNWNTVGLKLALGSMYTFVWVYNIFTLIIWVVHKEYT